MCILMVSSRVIFGHIVGLEWVIFLRCVRGSFRAQNGLFFIEIKNDRDNHKGQKWAIFYNHGRNQGPFLGLKWAIFEKWIGLWSV